uniref:Uncharacterized protein n=1 Tax=Rhizophora mucronata TaxID=61149 RepID=A0A2P2NE46_RHIMU
MALLAAGINCTASEIRIAISKFTMS